MSITNAALVDLAAPTETQVGKYLLVGMLGQGGMADVYLASSEGQDGFRKLCVVKMLRNDLVDDDAFASMFRDEARLAAKLNHPSIVQTYEVDHNARRPMMVMEYLEGQPLSRVRRRMDAEAFPLSAKVRVITEVVEALAYAHDLADFDGSSLGIVHRDVSPQNVMVTYEGRAKLLDFGIAKSTTSVEVTAAGVVKGKLAYMPPEQALCQEIDRRADIFAIGVMLWEFLCGKRISEGLTSAEVLAHRTIRGRQLSALEVNPAADPALAMISAKAMAFDRADRYDNAHVLCTELEQWLAANEQMSRRAWAATMRETFAEDRARVRTLIEQRFSAMGIDKPLPWAQATGAPPAVGPLVPVSLQHPHTDPSAVFGETQVTRLHKTVGTSRKIALSAAGVFVVGSLAVGAFVLNRNGAPDPREVSHGPPSTAATRVGPAVPGAANLLTANAVTAPTASASSAASASVTSAFASAAAVAPTPRGPLAFSNARPVALPTAHPSVPASVVAPPSGISTTRAPRTIDVDDPYKP